MTNQPDKPKPTREAFIRETSDMFLDKQGVALWQSAEKILLQQADDVTDQVIFEMGLRIGWKAALKAALTNNLPKDDSDDH